MVTFTEMGKTGRYKISTEGKGITESLSFGDL